MLEKMMFLEEDDSNKSENMVSMQEDIMGEINQSRMDMKNLRSDDPSL